MKTIGVIPARYQSSRFPGKPLADILGKPMIWWVYQQCIKVPELNEVYVATDDQRIYDVCEQYGIQVIMTSDQCRTGTDRVGEVAAKIDGDLFVNIQGDEPLIEPQMIRDIIGIFNDESVYYGSLRKQIHNRYIQRRISILWFTPQADYRRSRDSGTEYSQGGCR